VPAFDRETVLATETQEKIVSPAASTFWSKRINHFRLFRFTVVNADSDIFTLPAI
jgi:hypothetical protein